MRKIAAFYADTHREAQAVLKHIDGDVLEKMDFYLDAVGCRENPEEHSCEYAFREFCYGSPKTKKQLVIHDFVAPMDKEIVVPSLTTIVPISNWSLDRPASVSCCCHRTVSKRIDITTRFWSRCAVGIGASYCSCCFQ